MRKLTWLVLVSTMVSSSAFAVQADENLSAEIKETLAKVGQAVLCQSDTKTRLNNFLVKLTDTGPTFVVKQVSASDRETCILLVK